MMNKVRNNFTDINNNSLVSKFKLEEGQESAVNRLHNNIGKPKVDKHQQLVDVYAPLKKSSPYSSIGFMNFVNNMTNPTDTEPVRPLK